MPQIETLRWSGGVDGTLHLIDQTLLPGELREIECRDVATVWEAIKQLRVRGAPAIGIAAAYGVVLGVRSDLSKLPKVIDYLAGSRPTAVNLFWALDRMQAKAGALAASPEETVAALLDEAKAIHEEDRALCHAIG